MPVIYSLLRQFYHRCSSFDVRTLFKYFLLSFCASICVNLLLPSFAVKDSSSSSSSSLTLFTSTHIFFPSDVNSLQCSPIIISKRSSKTKSTNKRTYTKKEIRTNSNNSQGHRQEADMALHLAKQLASEGKYSKAHRVFQHALILDSTNAELLLEYGLFLEHYHQDIIQAENLYTQALITQPTHSRALQHQQRTLPLVEEIDQKHLQQIDHLLKEFYRIPESNSRLRRAKRDAYYLHIYHSNAIEGNTLTLDETKYIIETRLAIGGKSLNEQQEVIGLDAALHYVNCTLVNRLDAITLDDILSIHRRVFGYVNPIEAGHLRQHQVYVGSFTPPSANEVEGYLDDFLTWLNSLDETRDLHPIELAAIAHYKFVYIHPFIDGNGRTGRLIMNLILMRSGFPPIIIKFSDRFMYYAHLDRANNGDLRPLIRFIANCTERTLKEFIEQSHLTHRNDINDDSERLVGQERVVLVE